ncbi:MAG: metallophosphoesterase [Ignisphaera sp.]|nr:metallophosphoesterase [Ignisphaera sp.]
MLIHELSDIHLEMYQNGDTACKYLERIRPVETGDVVVLAGDISSLLKSNTLRYFDEFKKWAIEVVYVCGNHEYYGTNPTIEARKMLDKLQSEGVRVLGPDHHHSFTYLGVKFVGATCWYPYNSTTLGKVLDWSDKAWIKGFIQWWKDEQLRERELLWNEVTPGSVVVTHMLPTWSCISPEYSKDLYNCLYVADLEDLLLEKKPGLWYHGHSHEPLDLLIGETRCIRNPIGYPSERTYNTAQVLSIEYNPSLS